MRLSLMVMLVVASLFEGHRTADAAGVVGTGTPQSCTGNALAAALTGGGTVTFNCGSAPATIIVDTAVILNSDAATIVEGGGRITLDGESLRQLFLVLNGGNLTLRDIQLRHGFAGQGGAIRNAGTAHLERVNLSENQADGTGGGAIYNDDVGTLDVVDSTFFGNSVPSSGGALLNLGDAAVRRSLVATNFAQGGGGVLTSGTLVLSDDTFTNNFAEAGGGLYVLSGDVIVSSATFDRNFADHGGALYREVVVRVFGSVFSRSLERDQLSEALECDGTGASITSFGGNLAEDGSCQFNQDTDQNLTAPELGDLADNGGPTLTIAPLDGSPLIDANEASGCGAVDQRGFTRPRDGDHDGDAICDIGAVEVPEPAALPAAAAAAAALAMARPRRARRARYEL